MYEQNANIKKEMENIKKKTNQVENLDLKITINELEKKKST